MTKHNETRENALLKRVHWSDSGRSLDPLGSGLAHAAAPTDEEKKIILKNRAKALACELETNNSGAGGIEVIEFILGPEKYAIESFYVREIYPLKDLTPLPGTPSFILGIISIRGRIISVVDAKKFFDLPQKGLTDLNKVLVLVNEKMEFGLVADAVLGIASIRPADLRPALPTLTGIRAEYLKGLAREQLAVLDAAKLLSDERMVIHQKFGIRARASET